MEFMRSYEAWLLFLIPFLLCCNPSRSGSSNTTDNKPKDQIAISLITDENCHVKSTNPVLIKRDSDAVFEIEFDDGYRYNTASAEPIIDGSFFRFEDLNYSQNIYLYSRGLGDWVLSIENDDALGEVSVIPNKPDYEDGETVTVTVNPENGNRFMCYSYGHEYRNTDRYRPTGMPLSFSQTYSFQIHQDTVLHTNYFTDGLPVITYDANGGTTIDGFDEFGVDYQLTGTRLNPVSILGSYYLFKEGSTLESYNTKPDGTGERIGIGSRIQMELFDDNQITLYAQWAKWSNETFFSTEETSDGDLVITDWRNDGNFELVIPDVISGKTVTEIRAGAFDCTGVESIVLNIDLDIVEDGAFYNCQDLVLLTTYSGLDFVSDESFVDNSIESLRINSKSIASGSTPLTRDMSYQLDQIESFTEDKVIFVGQSTIWCNHDLAPMAEAYPDKDFYIFGLIAGTNSYFPYLILRQYLKPTDILVATILETSLAINQAGENFTFAKFCLDAVATIPYQEAKSYLLDSIPDSFSGFNEGYFCDVYNSEKTCPSYSNGGHEWGPSTDNTNNIDLSYRPRLDRLHNEQAIIHLSEVMDKTGVPKTNQYITWSTYNSNSVSDITMFEDFEEFVLETEPRFQTFDRITENIYPGNYFRENDSVHLSDIGGAVRVARWVDQIPIS